MYTELLEKDGIVVEDINSLKYTGKVKVSGQLWSAIADTDIPKDTEVHITQVDGVKLKVEPTMQSVEKIKF